MSIFFNDSRRADNASQAVAKYGQKWDQVQKALPQRGYHQVRQRWLRRLRACLTNKCRAWISLSFVGTMENNKSTEAGLNLAKGAATGQTMNTNGGTNPDPSTIPIPKLGMAPLSSELAVAAASNNTPAETPQPPNRPPPDPLQSTDLHNIQTSISPTVETSRPDPAPIDPAAVPTTPLSSEPGQAPQTNEPPSSIPDTTAPLPDPIPAVDPGEQSQPPGPDSSPSDPPPPDPPINVDPQPSNVESAPKEMN